MEGNKTADDKYSLGAPKSHRKTIVLVSTLVALVLAATIIVIALNVGKKKGNPEIVLPTVSLNARASTTETLLPNDTITLTAEVTFGDNVEAPEGTEIQIKWDLFNVKVDANGAPELDAQGNYQVDGDAENLSDYAADNTTEEYTVDFVKEHFIIRASAKAVLGTTDGKENAFELSFDVEQNDLNGNIESSISRTRSASWWLTSNGQDDNGNELAEDLYELSTTDRSATIKPGAQLRNLNNGKGAIAGADSVTFNLKELPIKTTGDYATIDLAFGNESNNGYGGQIRMQMAKTKVHSGDTTKDKYIFDFGTYLVDGTKLGTSADAIGQNIIDNPSFGNGFTEEEATNEGFIGGEVSFKFVRIVDAQGGVSVDVYMIGTNGEKKVTKDAPLPALGGTYANPGDQSLAKGGFRGLTLRGIDTNINPTEAMSSVNVDIISLTFGK